MRLTLPAFLLGALSSLLTTNAHAQQRDASLVDPRNIGRAGTSTVSGDSGVTLLLNPAGMVRRGQSRFIVGTSISSNHTSFLASDHPESPRIENHTAPTNLPMLAYHHGGGAGRWVLGALLWGGTSEVSLPAPSFGQPATDIERLFPHRYGGTAYQSQWRQLALGGAIRLGDSVGLGLTMGLRDVEVSEQRRIWAGFAGRDPLLSADRDLRLTLQGRDRLSPSAVLGVLVAPPELPLEFAVAVELQRGARLQGEFPTLRATSSSEFPQVVANAATARLNRPNTATVRAGVRYLGRRSFVEAGVDLTRVAKHEGETWFVRGLGVVDQSGVSGALTEIPALGRRRSSIALRGAMDYEAVLGFLWLTLGYAWQSPSTAQNWRMPANARLGGHRLATGILAVHEHYSLTMGYSRRLSRSRTVLRGNAAPVINPFGAKTAASNAGAYTSSSDQLGITVEISW